MFVECKNLEGTLIVSNLKIINKISTFPPVEQLLRMPMNDRAFSLSFFRVFTHHDCLFLSVLLMSVAI